MAVSRRGFLLLGSGQLNPYSGPSKSALAERGYGDDIAFDKRQPPIPVGGRSVRLFQAKCVGCLKCLEACPRGLLRPSPSVRHLARPTLDFRFGWCRPECNRCAEACPAGAIVATRSADEKLRFRPNVAAWKPERCVAATGQDECHACERHCPVHAIALVRKDGAAETAPRVPRVDESKCVGCGACEHFCPARPKSAMSVEGRAS